MHILHISISRSTLNQLGVRTQNFEDPRPFPNYLIIFFFYLSLNTKNTQEPKILVPNFIFFFLSYSNHKVSSNPHYFILNFMSNSCIVRTNIRVSCSRILLGFSWLFRRVFVGQFREYKGSLSYDLYCV